MKVTDRYYNKVYNETSKLTKKLFGKTVSECMDERSKLVKRFEDFFKLPIEKINSQFLQLERTELLKSGYGCIFFEWAKYKTISKILETLEDACMLKTIIIKEYENEC